MERNDVSRAVPKQPDDPLWDEVERRRRELGLDTPNPDLDAIAARLRNAFSGAAAMVNAIRPTDQTYVGLNLAEGRMGRTHPRDAGFCNLVWRERDGLSYPVGDVFASARHRNNPVTVQYGVRGYLGTGILDPRDGLLLGTMCVTFQQKRDLTNADVSIIEDFCRNEINEYVRKVAAPG